MNTITRCPACRTAFRVHRHQLEARGGQVRCGACGTVFDARAELEVLEPPALSQPEPVGEPEPFETLDLDLSQPLSTTNPIVVPVDAASNAAEPPSVEHAVGRRAAPPPEPDGILPAAPAKPAPIASPDAATLPPPSLAPAEFEEPPSLAEAPREGAGEPDVLDFGAPRRARRRRDLFWALASVPLLFVLAAQAAYYFRAELAALQPWTRPWLDAACLRIGCDIGLPKHASLLTVESANLEAEGGDVLTLYATLRNRADFDQALPSIELTLTDAREQAVARRLLAPGDYFKGADGRIAANGEIAVKVAFETVGVTAAGFRLEALYTP
ncbi:MAG: DUF3426 domain-containing protein [Burkholderiales bacterium]|jgi:predicted Zn finger-like uncharacterized protein|nr:DUF3426 domain-containing protein [Burkholderiales bacterium]